MDMRNQAHVRASLHGAMQCACSLCSPITIGVGQIIRLFVSLFVFCLSMGHANRGRRPSDRGRQAEQFQRGRETQ